MRCDSGCDFWNYRCHIKTFKSAVNMKSLIAILILIQLALSLQAANLPFKVLKNAANPKMKEKGKRQIVPVPVPSSTMKTESTSGVTSEKTLWITKTRRSIASSTEKVAAAAGSNIVVVPNSREEDDLQPLKLMGMGQWGNDVSDLARRRRQTPPKTAADFKVNEVFNKYFETSIKPWVMWAAPNLQVTTPKPVYGTCSLHKKLEGVYPTSDCLPGEVCVDKDTYEKPKVTCPASNPPCTCTPANSPVPDGCEKGCEAKDCVVSQNGVCVDDIKNATDFESQEVNMVAPTPMIFFAGTLAYDTECSAYGDLINSVQMGSTSMEDKKKNLDTNQASNKFGTEICNWSVAHLECIPTYPRMTTTTAAGEPPNQAAIDNYERPKGACKCMLALGTKPVVVTAKIKENEVEICYIPANMGLASECDHDILPPHGVIEGLTADGDYLFKYTQPASMFCVPHSECRMGYKYTGRRCMCKPKFVWDRKTGTCSKSTLIIIDATTIMIMISTSILRYVY